MPDSVGKYSAASKGNNQNGWPGVEAIQAFGIEPPNLSSVPMRPRKALRSAFDFAFECSESSWLLLEIYSLCEDSSFPLLPILNVIWLLSSVYFNMDTLCLPNIESYGRIQSVSRSASENVHIDVACSISTMYLRAEKFIRRHAPRCVCLNRMEVVRVGPHSSNLIGKVSVIQD